MSIIKVDYGNIDGGSSKYGVVENVTNSQEVTIETKLSSINKFVCYAYNSATNYVNCYSCAVYNSPSERSLYAFTRNNNAASTSSSITFPQTSHSHGNDAIRIYSISGGTVIVDIPSNMNTAYGTNLYWFAE